MIILFIVGLLLGVTTVIFVLQNIDVITVAFFSWHLTGSLALILSLAAIAGVIVTIFFILPKSINNYFRYRNLKKENKRLKEELRKQKELTIFAQKIPPTEEITSKTEQGDR